MIATDLDLFSIAENIVIHSFSVNTDAYLLPRKLERQSLAL